MNRLEQTVAVTVREQFFPGIGRRILESMRNWPRGYNGPLKIKISSVPDRPDEDRAHNVYGRKECNGFDEVLVFVGNFLRMARKDKKFELGKQPLVLELTNAHTTQSLLLLRIDPHNNIVEEVFTGIDGVQNDVRARQNATVDGSSSNHVRDADLLTVPDQAAVEDVLGVQPIPEPDPEAVDSH